MLKYRTILQEFYLVAVSGREEEPWTVHSLPDETTAEIRFPLSQMIIIIMMMIRHTFRQQSFSAVEVVSRMFQLHTISSATSTQSVTVPLSIPENKSQRFIPLHLEGRGRFFRRLIKNTPQRKEIIINC